MESFEKAREEIKTKESTLLNISYFYLLYFAAQRKHPDLAVAKLSCELICHIGLITASSMKLDHFLQKPPLSTEIPQPIPSAPRGTAPLFGGSEDVRHEDSDKKTEQRLEKN
jgi:hypothetical protein